MSFLLWLGILFLSCGWLFVFPIFSRPSLPWAILCFGSAVICIAVPFFRASPWKNPIKSFISLLISCVCAQLAIVPLFYLLGSRFHRIDFISTLVAPLVKLFGFEAHLSGGIVYVQSSNHLLPFTSTLEKLGLFPALLFITAAVVLVLRLQKQNAVAAAFKIFLCTGLYLLLRYMILIVLVLNHPDPRSLKPIEHGLATLIFIDCDLQMWSFLPLALILSLFVGWHRYELVTRLSVNGSRRLAWIGAVLVLSGAAAIAAHFQYHDPGTPKSGRILFDEVHSSKWELASKPFDTEWYGRDAVYNYVTFVEMLKQYYDVKLNKDQPYSDDLLENYDVLVLKTATSPFTDEEVEAIDSFVRGGGGLFLIGDHTDLLGMSTNLNKIAQRFDMKFNLDAANRLEDGQFQTFSTSPFFKHPATAWMSEISFMTSCTLTAPLSAENVMIVPNTFSDPVDYSAPSFFGNVIPDVEDDFGVHLLCAAMKVEKGRVLAFTDSTIFSTFGVMYEDRPEFLLGTMEYLNRINGWANQLKTLFLWVGLIGLSLSLMLFVAQPMATSVLLYSSCSFLGIWLGGLACGYLVESSYPLPDAKHKLPVIAFVDMGDFSIPPALVNVADSPRSSFDTFFVWTQRLEYLPRKWNLEKAVSADALVIINPTESLDTEQSKMLELYVRQGGKLLVMDTIWNYDSTVNEILLPFKLKVRASYTRESNVYARPEWRKTITKLSNPSINSPEMGLFNIQTNNLSGDIKGDDMDGLKEVNGRLPLIEEKIENRSSLELFKGELKQLNFNGVRAMPLRSTIAMPSLTLLGGTSLFKTDDERTLSIISSYGKGRIIVFVDSITFSRSVMGRQSDSVEHDDPVREVFEMEFQLIRDYLFAD
jgi:hypothetical protein